MTADEKYMQLALDLAASARGNTNPNPLVGAVIVKDGVIVGTGLHRKAGEPHAEVHAFRMAGEHAQGATLYVTLEPCSHYGKTPPCANLVKDSGVSRVVVAMQDPNPSVAGRGIQLLRDAGIEVEVGVLEEQSRRLNERFIHNMLTKRPFVLAKYAMTLDGKIAAHTGHSKWVTGEVAREDVHHIRHEVDGILVGVGTVIADNPSLTTRLKQGYGKNPVRIIMDSLLRIPPHAHVLNIEQAKTIIVCSKGVEQEKITALEKKGVTVLPVSREREGLVIDEMLEKLYQLGITDILVEGGSAVNASFLQNGAINKYVIYVAPKVLGGRLSLTPIAGHSPTSMEEAWDVEFDSFDKVGQDLRIIAYPKKGEKK
ncbi:bifunctional diaminohydroxyphosphoribosylaminopyrimidine deaminase/5-amino-6-(5-phosphoribosylamino)uracil reductase RibD [Lysinibacillus parviboronicapiens]|uniref:bifunctional diaminohydroxyphosphoribosylaminopyrimidine deaminase/5-amino-6-(5-phosphoribosylamino)uracil reductase RibD n=1 Tax=Lysinibacillus parviboronicapiens TaxID=436516 RepID=UPI0006D08BAD|nr:bifunctional diaminohydroxyphosphoribosylaminopyrimidine deaminase/5-amino-6-(5-phosphoribosylamino)uracil reductase RibD [Lysinibacillus parviboronicapiens]